MTPTKQQQVLEYFWVDKATSATKQNKNLDLFVDIYLFLDMCWILIFLELDCSWSCFFLDLDFSVSWFVFWYVFFIYLYFPGSEKLYHRTWQKLFPLDLGIIYEVGGAEQDERRHQIRCWCALEAYRNIQNTEYVISRCTRGNKHEIGEAKAQVYGEQKM